MTDTRAAIRAAMIARTSYWYNAVTCDNDALRAQIEGELAEADDRYESLIDAAIADARAQGRRK